jgi:alpha-D-ribose 1-methylphosphonate 5-triphosphate diphosphatase
MNVSLTLVGAAVLVPQGLVDRTLSLADGRIVDAAQSRQVRLPAGCRILPGIVDIHGDGFERHLAPRRGALRDLGAGLAATEAELAANGITTAILAQFWSWEGGMRGPDFARAFFAALAEYAGQGTDLRVQLRVEAALVPQDEAALLGLVDAFRISMLVVNDHLPHDALTAGKRPPRLTGQALKSGRSPDAHLALMQGLQADWAAVPDALAAFGTTLTARGVILGSHDDRTIVDRAIARRHGARLAEFPCTDTAARAAHDAGDGVIMGAPNVVRGGSHDGNVSATDLVLAGIVDALASDYHYPAPRIAALALADRIGLPAAWALVSDGPARLLGLTDRGQLAPGLRADLVVLDGNGHVGLTIAGGRITHASGAVAAALLG